MARVKRSVGRRNFVKFKDCAEGEVVAHGIYKGRGAPHHIYGQDFRIQPMDGGPMTILPNSGQLNWIEEQGDFEVGDEVEIIYEGRMSAEDWSKDTPPPHQFTVNVFEDDAEEDFSKEVEAVVQAQAEIKSEDVKAEEPADQPAEPKRKVRRKSKAAAAAPVAQDDEDECLEDLD